MHKKDTAPTHSLCGPQRQQRKREGGAKEKIVNQNWYAPAKEEVERLLHTNAATGLSPKAARLRYRKKKQSCGGELLSDQQQTELCI